MLACVMVLVVLNVFFLAIYAFIPANYAVKGMRNAVIDRNMLKMSVYSSDMGIPAALVEERDACGVGFIAKLNNKPTHDIIKQSVAALSCMEHRGACSSDNVSGDGSGILASIPWDLFKGYCDPTKNKNSDGTTACAVGMLFLPKDPTKLNLVREMIESIFVKHEFSLKWRDVPVTSSVLGRLANEFVPTIQQVIVQAPNNLFINSFELEKALYDIRREIMGYFRKLHTPESYVCSLSSRTIVYKGMLQASDLSKFYNDLTDDNFKSSFCIYHRRFSTNTVPKWFLAQPMRLLAHNGEINTLLGNVNWVKSRQLALSEGIDRQDEFNRKVRGPLVDLSRSDSANLDSVLESYVRAGSGRTPEESLMMLVPEAYESQPTMKHTPDINAFYSYYEALQEAWDGPALLVFSDGESVGAALDRNGLRPARFMLTANKNGEETVHVMSEVGVTKAVEQFATDGVIGEGEVIVDAGRLGPGQMLSVNLNEGKLKLNDEIKGNVASKRPYKDWLQTSLVKLSTGSYSNEVNKYINSFVKDKEKALSVLYTQEVQPIAVNVDDARLLTMQTLFGWGTEDVEVQISAMAAEGNEATFCMGDDAPLAALSAMPHTLYDYFKQRFAQVTNPPIDPLREGAVMSLAMFLGPRGEPLSFKGQNDVRIRIDSPILNGEDLDNIAKTKGVNLVTLSTVYSVKDALTVGGLESALDKLCSEAVYKVRSGATIINLSDRLSDYKDKTYIPPLMAVGAVHHALLEKGLRTKASIIITTGSAWSTHHMACLIGFGASAVLPYAAYDAVINWHGQKRNQLAIDRGDLPKLSVSKALANYKKSLDKGLLKILSKMGISLLTSYHGAQIFEAIGIADNVLLRAFKGTPSRVAGLTYDDIAAETVEFSRRAYGDDQFEGIASKIEDSNGVPGEEKNLKLFNYGFLNYFKSGDYHHNNQPLIKTLHSAIRTKDMNLFKLYEQSVTSRPPTTLRDTLQFKIGARKPVPLNEVESAESIMKRFCTGGMSLGALSREAHETLAIAMNRIGGKSNSGEGGEDPIRMKSISDVDGNGISKSLPHLKGVANGDSASSKIKQIASGRFGVTPQYLMSAQQLEIKVAQGAKPGEGGQLPGAKIDKYIATLRNSKPGVTLISPPPHHDIYSIEDLAQLIYDLHQINPKAGVSVKLVSEVGIGTVASGVAKAGADIIQISGHDGGTGASPASSIKHAGSPWELGLVEAHSTLLNNGLRERVLLRADGGLKSGWDVVMAAAMGAEEYGFGTIAMIAEGCIMARICHTNKCPVGVTTQNEALRKRFPGTPDNVVTFFGYVAEEVRHILAELGYKSLEEMIGQPGILQPRENLRLKKTSSIDVSYVLDNLVCEPKFGENLCDISRDWLKHGPVVSNGFTFDDKVLGDNDVMKAINEHGQVRKSYKVNNLDRSAFARVSGVIAQKYGDNNFQGNLAFDLTGAGGQSFAAFLSKGMEISLKGYANDYVCKGMNGGKVVISPPLSDDDASKKSGRAKGIAQHSVVGNTVLYGSTGGSLFVRGRAGERFAVRNSGATTVVEGLGDHGCEYMTAGNVVCLGSIGRNFGAGMTGGLAFILTDENWLDDSTSSKPFNVQEYINPESVSVIQLSKDYTNAKEYLLKVLKAHVDETGSKRAAKIISNIDQALSKIVLICPASEKQNPLVISAAAAAQTASV